MTASKPRNSRLWLNLLLSVLTVLTASSILLVGGHGGGFLYQYFLGDPFDIAFSPFGLPLWAALILPVASVVPRGGVWAVHGLCMLLLIGFFTWLYMLSEAPEITFVTAVPLMVVLVIEMVRFIRSLRKP